MRSHGSLSSLNLIEHKYLKNSDGDIRKWQSTLSQLMATYPNARVLPGHGSVTDHSGLQGLQRYFNDLEKLALSWKQQSLTQEQVVERFSAVPAPYKDYKFHGLYKGNLEIAYQQITRGS